METPKRTFLELKGKEEAYIPTLDEINNYILLVILKHKYNNPIYSYDIVDKVHNMYPHIKFNPIKLRKSINTLRQQGYAVIGCKHGYYIDYSEEGLIKQITSFNSRIHSLRQAREGLVELLKRVHAESKFNGIEIF